MNYWKRLAGRAFHLPSGMVQLLCPGWRYVVYLKTVQSSVTFERLAVLTLS